MVETTALRREEVVIIIIRRLLLESRINFMTEVVEMNENDWLMITVHWQ
jgi:hypothetical protein